MVQHVREGGAQVGVGFRVFGAPGPGGFAIPRFAALAKVGLKGLGGLLTATPGSLAQEGRANVDHDDAALLADGPEQRIIGVAQKARNEVSGAGMGRDNGYGREFENLIGGLIGHMGEIEHDARIIQGRHERLAQRG